MKFPKHEYVKLKRIAKEILFKHMGETPQDMVERVSKIAHVKDPELGARWELLWRVNDYINATTVHPNLLELAGPDFEPVPVPGLPDPPVVRLRPNGEGSVSPLAGDDPA